MIVPTYIVYGSETHYRVRPNPDGESGDGSEGIVIEWKDSHQPENASWQGCFFIAPDQAKEVAECIQRLLKDMK